MISGHGNIETAVAAIKRGAYDFIEKPFKSDRLILVATRALETSRLKREVKELKQLAPTASILTGHSPCMNQLRQTIERAAKANSRILIVGPSGSGKELAARTLHQHSTAPRARSSSSTPPPSRRSEWRRNCSDSSSPMASSARSARSKRRMAVRCSSTRSAICRARPRTRFCACWSTRLFSASAAPPRCRSTSASSRRPRAISRRRSPPVGSARTSITACRWCRSACRRCRSGARTFPS